MEACRKPLRKAFINQLIVMRERESECMAKKCTKQIHRQRTQFAPHEPRTMHRRVLSKHRFPGGIQPSQYRAPRARHTYPRFFSGSLWHTIRASGFRRYVARFEAVSSAEKAEILLPPLPSPTAYTRTNSVFPWAWLFCNG